MKEAGKDIAKEIKDEQDLKKKQTEYQKLAAILKDLRDLAKEEGVAVEEFNQKFSKLTSDAVEAGVKLSKYVDSTVFATNTEGKKVKKIYLNNKAIDASTKEVVEFVDVMEDAKEATARQTASIYKNIERLQGLGRAVKDITKEFLKLADQEQRFARQTATADAGWIEGMKEMYISQVEYMQLLKDTRIEGLAAATAGRNFKEQLWAGAEGLRGVTKNASEAAKVAGMFAKNAALMGVSQNNLNDAIGNQTKIYKENFRALGVTAEEFANLSTELINDQGMRKQLMTLQEHERQAFVQSIQRRQAEYVTMGYSIERAKELQKTFNALIGMNPRERMRQAARTRAMMGAMGMGAEGARLFELQTRIRTMTGEKRESAMAEMAKIQSKAASRFGGLTGAGAGLGQSMAFEMMADKTGFNKIAETFETESGEGRKIDKDMLKETNEINTTVSDILTAVDFFGAAQNSSIGSIATNIVSKLGGIIMTGFGTVVGAILAVRTAVMMGKAAGAIGGLLSKGKGGITKAATAAVGGGSLLKGGKTAGKMIASKLPGIGALVGAGLAIHAASQGDYTGAALHAAAGLATTIPGIGTAAAIGLEGYNMMRDVPTPESKKPQTMATEMMEKTGTEYDPSTVLMELTDVMRSIEAYLQSTQDSNMASAKAMNKVGDSMDTSIRMGNLPGARAGG